MPCLHSLPLIESLPRHLNGTDDTLLKVLRVLLHDDDALLERVLLVDLFLKLTSDQSVGVPEQSREQGSDREGS